MMLKKYMELCLQEFVFIGNYFLASFLPTLNNRDAWLRHAHSSARRAAAIRNLLI